MPVLAICALGDGGAMRVDTVLFSAQIAATELVPTSCPIAAVLPQCCGSLGLPGQGCRRGTLDALGEYELDEVRLGSLRVASSAKRATYPGSRDGSDAVCNHSVPPDGPAGKRKFARRSNGVNRKRVTTCHRGTLRELRRRFVAALEDGRVDPHERADILDGLDGADAEAAVIDITDGVRAISPERTDPVLAELAAWMARLPAA